MQIVLAQARRIAGTEQAAGTTVAVPDAVGHELVGQGLATYVNPWPYRPARDALANDFDVRAFGATVDGVVLYDGACTNASAVVTSATAAFTADDVGKYFSISPRSGAGSQTRFRGVISSVQSPTQFTASANSTTTISGGSLVYGTDNGVAINLAIAAATPRGGTIFFPEGVCISTLQHVVPGGCRFRGVGRDYPLVHDVPARGSSLVMIAFFGSGAFVQLGDDTASFASGETIACIEDMSVDAINGVNHAVQTNSRRNRVERCTIWRGNAAALYIGGPDSWVLDNILGQQNDDIVLDVRTGDCHVFRNHIRQAGNGATTIACVRIMNATDVIYEHNHHFRGGAGESLSATYSGPGILVRSTGFDGRHSNIKLDNNVFDGTYGPHVMVKVGETSPTELQALSICGNTIFQSGGFASSTFPVVHLVPESGSVIRGLQVCHNKGIGALPHPVDEAYTHIVSNTGAGSVVGANVSDNAIQDCAAFWTGFTPAIDHGNVIHAVSSTEPIYSSEFVTEITVSTSEVLALNATPKQLIPAPGVGYALVFLGAQFWYDYNSAAYAGIAAGDDLAIRYTNGSGAIVGTCEATGLLDQTADETRWVYPLGPGTAPDTSVEPPANAALMLHMTGGEITTGNSPLKIRIRARIVPTSW